MTATVQSEEGERDERRKRQETEIGDAGWAGSRPGDPGTKASLAPLCEGPDDGRRIRWRSVGPLRWLRARRIRRTPAAGDTAAIHRGDAQGLARSRARHGPAGRDRGPAADRERLTDFFLPRLRRSTHSASSPVIG